MRFIDAATTRRHLGFDTLIPALRAMFVADCEVPLRHTHRIDAAAGSPTEGGTVLLMPAWRKGARLGIKTVTIFPGNAAQGLPGLHSTYLLLDADTGVPLAQIDGNEITSRRTAAASALAASYLAREDARRLLVVGAGRVAALLPEAMRAVRTIDDIAVWSRRFESAQQLAARLQEQGLAARAVTDLAQATAQADIISCATLATEPLIRGEWLREGSHLDLIGSFTPAMHETDAACFARSSVYVDTPEALQKSGDVLRAIQAGAFDATQVRGTLAELCAGTCAGRVSAAQCTLFKSVGNALEDLAAAELVFDAVAGTAPSADPNDT